MLSDERKTTEVNWDIESEIKTERKINKISKWQTNILILQSPYIKRSNTVISSVLFPCCIHCCTAANRSSLSFCARSNLAFSRASWSCSSFNQSSFALCWWLICSFSSSYIQFAWSWFISCWIEYLPLSHSILCASAACCSLCLSLSHSNWPSRFSDSHKYFSLSQTMCSLR